MVRKNYTEKEKRELLNIVNTFKHIIENKCTNAVSMEKKAQAWDEIANLFNASAEFPRTSKQLNTAYQNLKRVTRQRVADENMQNYVEYIKHKKDNAADKKAVMATGGGQFTPQLSDVGAQMLALIGNHVKPLSNDCDSAANYYSLNEHTNIEVVYEAPKLQNQDEPEVEVIHRDEIEVIYQEPLGPVVPKVTDNNSSPRCRRQPNLKKVPKLLKTNNNNLKRKIYLKKLECTLIDKKTKLVNYRVAIKQEKLIDLEIKIKQLEWSKNCNS